MSHRREHQGGGEDQIELADTTSAALLQADAIDRHGTTICHNLLTGGRLANRNVLAIDFRRSTDQWIREWKEEIGELPNALRLIVTEEAYRSAAVSEPESMTSDLEITPISNPQDLTAIGIQITDCLDNWSDEEVTVTACLDSLSTMLQYTSFDPVFRFLHVFIRQLDSIDATGHFHIDPTAHDEQTLTRLYQIFDAVITIEGGTVVSIRER
ncbi:MAG: hypothetical protein ABEH65_05775 [Halobacteriales archaeon]